MNHHVRFHSYPLAGIDPMTAETDRAFPKHTHDQYGIGLIDSGGHASWSDRGHVEAGPGHFICANPAEVHDGRAIGGQIRRWRILYFEPSALSEARTDIFEGSNTSFAFAAPVFADEPLHRQFNDAFRYAVTNSELRDKMACETAVLKLTARLSTHSSLPFERDSGPTACIRRAKNRIDDDPTATLTLIDLAKDTGLSRYQLIRSFTRQLGLPPHAYILQRRLALARRLIRTGRSLSEVAVVAGFYDQRHLTRCFARQYGVTPSRYALALR